MPSARTALPRRHGGAAGWYGAKPSNEPVPVSSMTVTNEIKKHFPNESRQGVAPARVFARRRRKYLLRPPPCSASSPEPRCGGKVHRKPQEKGEMPPCLKPVLKSYINSIHFTLIRLIANAIG